MTTTTETQCERLLAHFKAGGTLTQLEAYRHPFRTGRLASRVHDLRGRGVPVEKRMERVGRDGSRVARYYLGDAR